MVYYIPFHPQEVASAWTQAQRDGRPQPPTRSLTNREVTQKVNLGIKIKQNVQCRGIQYAGGENILKADSLGRSDRLHELS